MMCCSCCCTMKEIIPYLWIGNIHSLIELKERQEQYEQQQQNQEYQQQNQSSEYKHEYEYWTVISLVHNKRLINYTKLQIATIKQNNKTQQQQQLQQQQNELKVIEQQEEEEQQQQQQQEENYTNNETTVESTARETVIATTSSNSKKLVILNHIQWDLQDTYNTNFLSTKLIDILSIIDTNNKKYNTFISKNQNKNHQQQHHHHHTLIHCIQVKSRCVSVCIAYLLSQHVFTTLQDAMDHIRFIRAFTGSTDANVVDSNNNDCTTGSTSRCNSSGNNCTNPNLSFIASLRSIEQCNGYITQAIQRQNSNKTKI